MLTTLYTYVDYFQGFFFLRFETLQLTKSYEQRRKNRGPHAVLVTYAEQLIVGEVVDLVFGVFIAFLLSG
jgi:hypothetical protein